MRWRLIAAAGLFALWGGVARGGAVGPDLEVTLITGPLTASAGEVISVDYTVINSAPDPAIAFSIGIYVSNNAAIDPLSDRLLLDWLVSGGLAAFDSIVDAKNVAIPGDLVTDVYFIGVYADCNLQAGDRQYNNNDLSFAIGILGAPPRRPKPETPFDGGCSPGGGGSGPEAAAWLLPFAFALVGRLRRKRRAGAARR